MASLRPPADPNLRQMFGLVVAFTILLQVVLQAFSVAVTYIYFSSEVKKMQETYSKSITACFLKEDVSPWGSTHEGALNNPCWLVKQQMETLVRKMVLRMFEETTSTQEKQQSYPFLPRERGPQRVAAHITGALRRSSVPSAPSSKNNMALGQKIYSWESSRKGHSFLSNLHLWKGELVIHKAGLYYIYSQTYFRFQEPEDTSLTGSKEGRRKQVKQMVQYIYKYTSYPDPILLMKSARNSCWAKNSEYGLYSIYQGGIFELKESDRIFVSVTNESLIDLEQEASFFGAFLVE